MHMLRCHWPAAAGLLLAAAGPAAAQAVPDAAPPPPPAQAEAPPEVKTLPPPRPSDAPAPAAAPAPAVTSEAAGPACQPAGFGGSWQQWRAERHARCQAKMWGYPEEFVAPPLGASVYANCNAMVANGRAASMVLFLYDFLDGCPGLNPHGLDRLARMAAQLPDSQFPIVIERTLGMPELAEARRAAVLAALAHEGIAVPPERVVIGPRLSVGLPGADAVRVYRYHVNNMGIQSTPIPVTGAGGSGISVGSSSGVSTLGTPTPLGGPTSGGP
jgi:hypothetical protein